MTLAYVGAGSNLGDRRGYLDQALAKLKENQALSVRAVSKVYETAPEGYLPQGPFLNAVWEIETELSAESLFKELMSVEQHLGRVRGTKYGPRTIDLDLLAFGDAAIDAPGLTVPHPHMHERTFVLKPFNDVNPGWRHPLLGKTAAQLLQEKEPAL